ncbi:hypothetical protein NDU88_002963, partial [Pleurodeles waltl]
TPRSLLGPGNSSLAQTVFLREPRLVGGIQRRKQPPSNGSTGISLAPSRNPQLSSLV